MDRTGNFWPKALPLSGSLVPVKLEEKIDWDARCTIDVSSDSALLVGGWVASYGS